MTPEVFEVIRRDLNQCMPAILAGEDPVSGYPDGWAVDNAPVPTVNSTARYVASTTGRTLEEVLRCAPHSQFSRERLLVYLVVSARFPKLAVVRVAARLGKDRGSVRNGVRMAQTRLNNDQDFRRRYERICMDLGI